MPPRFSPPPYYPTLNSPLPCSLYFSLNKKKNKTKGKKIHKNENHNRQKNNKTKNARIKQKETKSLQKISLHSFCAGQFLLGMSLHRNVVDISSCAPLEQTNFPFARGLSVANNLLVMGVTPCLLPPLSTEILSGLKLCSPCA